MEVTQITAASLVFNKVIQDKIKLKFPNIKYLDNYQVVKGVHCYTYKFLDDNTKDLAIVLVAKNYKTPRQKVLKGDKTTEGILHGKGKIVITRNTGEIEIINNKVRTIELDVYKGDVMQWFADKNSDLIFYEICYPPYKEGRFKNL